MNSNNEVVTCSKGNDYWWYSLPVTSTRGTTFYVQVYNTVVRKLCEENHFKFTKTEEYLYKYASDILNSLAQVYYLTGQLPLVGDDIHGTHVNPAVGIIRRTFHYAKSVEVESSNPVLCVSFDLER